MLNPTTALLAGRLSALAALLLAAGVATAAPGATRKAQAPARSAPQELTTAADAAAPAQLSAPAAGLPAPGAAVASDPALLAAGGTGAAAHPPGERRAAIVMRALSLLGVNYRFGGSSPETGLDCSGFVRHVFRETVGTLLPRRSEEISRAAQGIDPRQLKPGDLVFFNTLRRTFSHVGIYIGNNQFVHAPSRGGQIRVETLDQPYWLARFNGARRVVRGTPEATALAAAGLGPVGLGLPGLAGAASVAGAPGALPMAGASAIGAATGPGPGSPASGGTIVAGGGALATASGTVAAAGGAVAAATLPAAAVSPAAAALAAGWSAAAAGAYGEALLGADSRPRPRGDQRLEPPGAASR